MLRGLRGLGACACRAARADLSLARGLASEAGSSRRAPAGRRRQAQPERLAVLFPRKTGYQTSFEVKRRILYSTPHMGGKRLKRLARKHAREGTVDSFVGDLESRLDRFLYRLNLVPSIFAARQVIGHSHVLVNGRVAKLPGLLLKPQDIVEPAPHAVPLFKRMIRQRLETNTFRLVGEGSGGVAGFARQSASAAVSQGERAPDAAGAVHDYDLDKLRQDAQRSAPPAARRMPAAAEATPAAPAAREDALAPMLSPLLLSLLGVIGEGPLGATLRRSRDELHVACPGGLATSPLDVVWRSPGASESKLLARLDRVRVRRLLLGLLALQPEAGAGSTKSADAHEQQPRDATKE